MRHKKNKREKSWERAKISLRNVNESCRIDLSELSHMPLEVEMASMDEGRGMKNRGGQVRRRGRSVLHGSLRCVVEAEKGPDDTRLPAEMRFEFLELSKGGFAPPAMSGGA